MDASDRLAGEPAAGTRPRIVSVDVVRGFALLGILAINIGSFAAVPGGTPDLFSTVPAADRLLNDLLLLLVESKFFTLFSFLFGLSFSIILIGAQDRGTPFVPLFARRLTALLAFGLLHVVLLWDGDILVIYAVTGAALLLFRNASDRTLLRWVAGLLLVPLALVVLATLGLAIARALPLGASLPRADASFVRELVAGRSEAIVRGRTASFGDLVSWRVREYTSVLPLLLSRIPTVLAMFLLGLWVGRRQILRDVEGHLDLLRAARRWGWALGLPASAAVVVAASLAPPLNAIVVLLFGQVLTGPLLALAYGATLVLALRDERWVRRLCWLAYPGRMALTVYLSQSLVMGLLFLSYGLGLVGRVSTATSLAIAAALFAVQVVACRLWLASFRYGPLEWLWRAATTWSVPPVLRRVAPQPGAG